MQRVLFFESKYRGKLTRLPVLPESRAFGDLHPIKQPISLADYYKQYLRTNELLDEAEEALRLYAVSLISEEEKKHFGLWRCGKLLFGKYCKKVEFKRESAAFSALSAKCPYIVPLVSAVQANAVGEGFIITKRYNRYSFSELKPFVKEVTRQLLQAISCCHANDIIHRDIKPHNIVWEWKDQKPHIYLIDFSIAVKLEHYRVHNDVDSYSEATLVYRAPERMRRRVSEEPKKMDLWSAGVMFAEMLLSYDSDDKTLLKWGDLEELEEFQAKRDELFQDIDPVARDLLDKILTIDVKQRLSADEALQPPYFTQPSNDEEQNTQLVTTTERKRKRKAKNSTKKNKKRRNS